MDTAKAQVAKLTEDLRDEMNQRKQAKIAEASAEAAAEKAQQETARIKAMNDDWLNKQGLTPSKILAEHKELPLVKGELGTIKQENNILMNQFTKIKDEYMRFQELARKVLSPWELRKIVAVDPCWKFGGFSTWAPTMAFARTVNQSSMPRRPLHRPPEGFFRRTGHLHRKRHGFL